MNKQILLTGFILFFWASSNFVAQVGNSSSRVPINDIQELNTCGEGSGDVVTCEGAEHPIVRQSIGLNYNFFDEARPAFIEDVAPNWRQFTQWHNTGDNSNELCPDDSMLNLYPWDCNIEPAPGANSFNETFTYFFTNFTGAPVPAQDDKPAEPAKINYTLNNTRSVDFFYPAFNSSIHNLSTSQFNESAFDQTPCDEGEGWQTKMDERSAIWRKPVPHWENPLFPEEGGYLEHEDYSDPNSYRFFAEYLSYYFGMMGSGETGMMGSGEAMPTNMNYKQFLFDQNNNEITGVGYHNHAEIWNEPDAWWTWPNTHGYFTPQELAAFSHAAIGVKPDPNASPPIEPVTQTIINEIIPLPNPQPQGYINPVPGGINAYREHTAIISPSPHEMDVAYMIDYLDRLEGIRGERFDFQALAFHHYSAYSVDRLEALFSNCQDCTTICAANPGSIECQECEECVSEDGEWIFPSPNQIATQSMSRDNPTKHPINLCSTTQEIETVNLEASPGDRFTSYWIAPESDGYFQRGAKLRAKLTEGGVAEDKPIWITEWGYNTNVSNSAKYPKGLNPAETQARWLMRGFLEYDRSIDIQHSFWHWYQDTNDNSWDNTCGLITNGGQRKASWYYLRTLMDQIGNKSFFESRTLEGCSDLQTPSFSIVEGEIVGEPELDCPRIYKYGSDCCQEETGVITDNYINNVWVTWFPSMINKEPEIDLYLETDLGIVGQPLQYFTVEPRDGFNLGFYSPLTDLKQDPVTDEYFITVKITEKPLFIHFVGECACNNDEPGFNPAGCDFVSVNKIENITCTDISIQFDVSATAGCNEGISITSVNSGGFSFSGNAGFTPSFDGSTVTLNYTGLDPGQEYTFNVGVGFNYGIDQGYQNFTFTVSTLADNCFNRIEFNGVSHTIGYECKSADVNVTLDSPSTDDVSILSIIGTFQQVLSDNGEATCQSPTISALIPLGASPAPDWFVDNTSYTTSFTLNNLTPDGCYCVRFWVADGVGNVYDETSSIVCINDDDCVSNPGPVQDIDATCDRVCFTPAVFIDEEGVAQEATAYRLEITDQEGNVDFVFKTDFSDSCDGEPNPDGKLCFCSSEVQSIIDDIGRPPYVGHIRTHYQEQDDDGSVVGEESTTNSNLFTVEECCTEAEFEDPEIIYSYNSCDRYQFAHFCLTELPGCVLEEDGSFDIFNVSVESDFPTEVIIAEGLEESCITIEFFTNVMNSCSPFNYSITITYTNIYGDIMTHIIDGEVPYCCAATPPIIINPGPDGPNPDSPVFFRSVYPDDNQGISVRAEIEERLEEKVQESRQRHIPVFYTLIDKETNKFLKSNQYSTELYLNFPEPQYDKEVFNQKYGLYLLANNKVYTLEFPDYNLVDERDSSVSQKNTSGKLKVYPNPSSSDITITLNGDYIQNVKVYDQNGILHKVLHSDSKELKVSLRDLVEGVYYLHIEDVSGNRYIEKVVFMK